MNQLTPYEQIQLARLQKGCIANTQINPITRSTLHKLRELKLVDFRAGWDDFEWFALPQETETQEAPAAVVEVDVVPFTPRKGMRVEFQKAFASDKAWHTGLYWGVYAGNTKLHMVWYGGISEPAWNVRSLMGEHAKSAALEGQIVKEIKPLTERVASIRDTDLREVAAALFDIDLPTPEPVAMPSNGAIEDVVYTPVAPTVPPMDEIVRVGNVLNHIIAAYEALPDETEVNLEPAPDIFNGLADFEPRPRAVERMPVYMPKLNVTPAAFKQVNRGVMLSTSKVFSRKSQWNGQGWIVGRWNELLALALMPDGTLLLLDAGLACEVRPRKVDTLDALFTAWAGVDWNAKLKARV